MKYPSIAAAMGETQGVPPKIESAMDWLRFAHAITCGHGGGEAWQGGAQAGRELTVAEKKVYDAALATLLRYFLNPDLGLGTRGPEEQPPDDPKERVPVA